MTRTIRFLLLAGFTTAAAGFIGYLVGGWLGFHTGYAVGHHATDLNHAGLVVRSLQALDRGETAYSRELLETSIDGAIVLHGTTYSQVSGEVPLYAPSEAYLDFTGHINLITRYRSVHPSTHPDADVRELIRAVLHESRGSQ